MHVVAHDALAGVIPWPPRSHVSMRLRVRFGPSGAFCCVFFAGGSVVQGLPAGGRQRGRLARPGASGAIP